MLITKIQFLGKLLIFDKIKLLLFSVKNKEESANGNLAIIDNGQTAKLFNHQLKTTERTAVVDAATVD